MHYMPTGASSHICAIRYHHTANHRNWKSGSKWKKSCRLVSLFHSCPSHSHTPTTVDVDVIIPCRQQVTYLPSTRASTICLSLRLIFHWELSWCRPEMSWGNRVHTTALGCNPCMATSQLRQRNDKRNGNDVLCCKIPKKGQKTNSPMFSYSQLFHT